MTDVLLMLSGGKDSSYMVKYCLDNNIRVDRYLFTDTGLQYPVVYGWLDYLEDKLNISIERIKAKHTFDELFFRKRTRGSHIGHTRGFPLTNSGWFCWILRDLKLKPAFDFVKKEYPDKDYTKLFGFCAGENREIRSESAMYPLVDAELTEFDIIRRCKKENLYPPLYYLAEKHGAKIPRSGCWLCPKQGVDACRMMFFEFPDHWKQLKKLESQSEGSGFRWSTKHHLDKLEKIFQDEFDIPQRTLADFQ